MIAFLTKNIISRFGIPDYVVFDSAKYLSFIKMTTFALEYGIKLKHSANYYPHGNGLVESMNKNLVNIIKKTVDQNPRNWHAKLPLALWAEMITPKESIKNSPFFLVYGQEAILPTHIFLPSLRLSQSVQVAECPIMQQ